MKIIRNIIIFLGILVGILIVADLIRPKKTDHSIPWVPQDLDAATEILNRNCPEMIDPETRLDSVIFSEEGQLFYYYTLTEREESKIDPTAFTAYMIPEVISNVRKNPYLKMHRDSSVTIVFDYRDRDGVFVAEFFIGPKDYR